MFKRFKEFTLVGVIAANVAIMSAQSGPKAGVDWPGFRGIWRRGRR
jgi:hypothetical protein